MSSKPTTGKSVGKPRLPYKKVVGWAEAYHREIGREATASSGSLISRY